MEIYDCFTFYNELELLDIRIKLLDSYVDHFVIIEMPRTHRGEKKPLYFKNNAEKYKKYRDKIIYYCPDDRDIPGYKGDGDWTLENYQRNCILRAITNCHPEDVIIVSDIDEIPDLRHIFKDNTTITISTATNKNTLIQKKKLFAVQYGRRKFCRAMLNKVTVEEVLDDGPISCRQDLFYYYLNCKSEGKWYGSIITKYKNMCMPQYLRDRRNLYPTIINAGWHFSYMGGLEKVKTKLKTIIDKNNDIIEKMKRYANDDEYIIYCLENGLDIYGREQKESRFSFINPEEIGIEGYRDIYAKYPQFFKDIE